MKTRWLFVLAVLIAATLACSVDTGSGGSGGSSSGGGSTEADISGEYDVEGVNQDGSQYSGEATITKVGDSYNINWLIADQTQTGEGTLTGNTFRVTWSAGDIGGDGVYTLQSNGVLEGTWTQDDVDGSGTETLTPK